MLLCSKWSYFSCSRIGKKQYCKKISPFQNKHHPEAPRKILSFEQVPQLLLDAL